MRRNGTTSQTNEQRYDVYADVYAYVHSDKMLFVVAGFRNECVILNTPVLSSLRNPFILHNKCSSGTRVNEG